MLWWSKKKSPPPSVKRNVNETHIVFSLCGGIVNLSVLPRMVNGSEDENAAGSELCSLYRAIVDGELTNTFVRSLSQQCVFSPSVTDRVVATLKVLQGDEGCVDPRDVFPG